MKEGIALAVGLSIASVTMYFAISKQISTALTGVLLVFALLAGLTIANYNLIERFKGLGFEVVKAKKEISSVKEQAISELQQEVDTHKESITLLIKTANELRGKIEGQMESLETINAEAATTKAEIEVLNAAASDLALLLVTMTWLQVQTKGEFGTKRSKAATEKMQEELNKIVRTVIPNPEERVRWIKDMEATLPPRD